MAWARRSKLTADPLIAMLQNPSLEARYGACQALEALRGRAAPAVAALQSQLDDSDLWLRIRAADALAAIGGPARVAVPQLLQLLAINDPVADPRGMQQRYLAFALFDRQGLLNKSLDGVDRSALYEAVKVGLGNQDGRARGSLSSVYRNLTSTEIAPLLPAIYQAVQEPAPSGEMFADSIRIEGLRLLAKHHVQEGIAATVQYTREQNPWNSQKRTPELMEILLSYGTHAQTVVPELTEIANYFEKDEPNFPKHLMAQKAQCVRDTIQALEKAQQTPTLIPLQKFGRE